MSDFPAMTIISGAPGSGKTTISKALASRWENQGGNILRLDSDTFFTFPQSLISPDQSAAKSQNEAIARAIAAAAITFAEADYNVIIDGVIGPWILPQYLKIFKDRLRGLSYVVLRAPLADTLERARLRPDSEKYSLTGVKLMHPQFADLKMFEPHVIETGTQTAVETLGIVEKNLRERFYQFELS